MSALEALTDEILSFPGKLEGIISTRKHRKAFITYLEHTDMDLLFKLILSDAFDNGATADATTGAITYIDQRGADAFISLVKMLSVLKTSGKAKIRIEKTGDISIRMLEAQ